MNDDFYHYDPYKQFNVRRIRELSKKKPHKTDRIVDLESKEG